MRTQRTLPLGLRALAGGVARVVAWVAAVALAAGLTVAVSAAPASADVGDGLWACSSGEICFKENNDTAWNSDIKHFWWSQQHGILQWCPCEAGNGGNVYEEASMYWNRDTECTAYTLDAAGNVFTMSRSASWYQYYGFLWNNANFGHTRCSPTQPWGT